MKLEKMLRKRHDTEAGSSKADWETGRKTGKQTARQINRRTDRHPCLVLLCLIYKFPPMSVYEGSSTWNIRKSSNVYRSFVWFLLEKETDDDNAWTWRHDKSNWVRTLHVTRVDLISRNIELSYAEQRLSRKWEIFHEETYPGRVAIRGTPLKERQRRARNYSFQ